MTNQFATRVALGLAATVMVISGGCMRSQKTTVPLVESVRGYADGLRWRNHPAAATYIPSRERADFLEHWEQLEDEFLVTDYQLARVKPHGDKRATVRVKYTWHFDARGVVNSTMVVQKWERRGKRWFLVEERRLRGEPMPGVAEPDPVKEPDLVKEPVSAN